MKVNLLDNYQNKSFDLYILSYISLVQMNALLIDMPYLMQYSEMNEIYLV